VSLGTYAAGHHTTANISFTTSNSIPRNGHLIVTFPSNFTSISTTEIVSRNMDGGLTVIVDGYTVQVQRDGTGNEVGPRSEVMLQLLDGLTNPTFQGQTTIFPEVKTTPNDTTLSIDEASSRYNQGDRIQGLTIIPASFGQPPTVELASLVAGHEGAATVNLTLSNPLPADGNILVEFPRNFTSINCTAARATGMDGTLGVWVASDGYTVRVRRAGDGTVVQAGAEITLELLHGIKNQEFEGLSGAYPMIKTTLADTDVAIDESSGDFNRDQRPAAVLFTPASFGQPPTVELASLVAGHEGAATVNLTLTNPLPVDGNILVEFPRNFTSINCTAARATGMDGTLGVWVASDGYTVRVRRAGDGTVVQAGAEITLELLHGIK
ncbi:unnamed protein product, partial [Scytosiphon promiscuus]